MATSSLSLPQQQPASFSNNKQHKPQPFRFRSITITAATSTPSRSSSTPDPGPKPIRPIPGDCGHPIFGPIKDRHDFFYHQGCHEFFNSRIKKHNSTVFRVNMPPGPPISPNSNVVVLLDGKSFPVLFDTTKVEKKDVFTGTFIPSTDLTGGYRPLSYLDPSEANHANLKRLVFFLLKSTRDRVIPEFQSSYSELFDTLESELAKGNKAEFNGPAEHAAFNFLSRAWLGADPTQSKIGLNAPSIIRNWVLFQLAPILSLGLPKCIEELALRSFRLPAALIKGQYNELYEFFYENSAPILEEASKIGISRDEACHNLVYATCFNSLGGMNLLFPILMKLIGKAGKDVQAGLAREIRSAVRSAGGGRVTVEAIEQMPLMKSAVFEALRLEPPVPSQYGRAKRDFLVESHEAGFEVKKGELLLGFQPFATRDPVIFERPEEFVPDRFVGEEGERLLRHVVWSNGPQTEGPTVNSKQCAGKDFVVLVARMLVVEVFLRYDSFDVDVGSSPLGCKVAVTKLERATSKTSSSEMLTPGLR